MTTPTRDSWTTTSLEYTVHQQGTHNHNRPHYGEIALPKASCLSRIKSHVAANLSNNSFRPRCGEVPSRGSPFPAYSQPQPSLTTSAPVQHLHITFKQPQWPRLSIFKQHHHASRSGKQDHQNTRRSSHRRHRTTHQTVTRCSSHKSCGDSRLPYFYLPGCQLYKLARLLTDMFTEMLRLNGVVHRGCNEMSRRMAG